MTAPVTSPQAIPPVVGAAGSASPAVLSPGQFDRLFAEYRSSAARIETLPVYTVGGEQQDFRRYLAGAPLPPDRNAGWAARIRAAVSAGKYMGRVHVIGHVLTPYLQFETDWYYAVNSAAGEDIRFVFREDAPEVPHADTWLFDDRHVVDLSYDAGGRLLHIARDDSPERVRQARTAWAELRRRSFPLDALLAMIRSRDLTLSAAAAFPARPPGEDPHHDGEQPHEH